MSFYFRLLRVIIAAIFFTIVAQPACAEPPLVLCIDEWPPYEYNLDGKPAGYFTELVTAVLKSMDQEIDKIMSVSWNRGLEMVRSGQAHALFSAFRVNKRESYAWFPDEPLENTKWHFFIREDKSDQLKFRTIEDVKGHRVGTVKGYVYTKEFMDYIRKNPLIVASQSSPRSFRLLLENRLDFVLDDLAVGMHEIRELGAAGEIVPVGEALFERPTYVMFSKASVSKEFVDRFSHALAEFKKTPEYQALRKKLLH